MSADTDTYDGKYSVGQALGRALAIRLIELSRPGATIIDNCAVVVDDRRTAGKHPLGILGPHRRRTDSKPSE